MEGDNIARFLEIVVVFYALLNIFFYLWEHNGKISVSEMKKESKKKK